MPVLNMRYHPDRNELIFPDIEEGQGVEGQISEVVCVANGVSGDDGVDRPSVLIRIELPDGKSAIAMTTARLFCAFADTIKAKHPQAFEAP